MANKSRCPRCGKQKKPQFQLCYQCHQKNKKQKPIPTATSKLQKLMIKRKTPTNDTDKKKPRSIKDWIDTDIKEWDQFLNESE